MQALILAAGFGVRLREIIHGRPKHLVLINGQPFLRHLVKLLKKNQINEIILAVGYLAQYIIDEFAKENEGLKINFSEDDRPLGTAGSLKAAEAYFKNDFFVLNGDTYLDIDFQAVFHDHLKNKKIMTMVVNHKNISCGVYVFSPKVFSLIPEKEKYSLENDVIPHLRENKQIYIYQTAKNFIDIGSPTGYEEAKIKIK